MNAAPSATPAATMTQASSSAELHRDERAHRDNDRGDEKQPGADEEDVPHAGRWRHLAFVGEVEPVPDKRSREPECGRPGAGQHHPHAVGERTYAHQTMNGSGMTATLKIRLDVSCGAPGDRRRNVAEEQRESRDGEPPEPGLAWRGSGVVPQPFGILKAPHDPNLRGLTAWLSQ